jgi:hypothetical protein
MVQEPSLDVQDQQIYRYNRHNDETKRVIAVRCWGMLELAVWEVSNHHLRAI